MLERREEGRRAGETQRKRFKIAAGFSSAEIKAALHCLCSAVADLCSEVFLDARLSPPFFFFCAVKSEK